MAHLGTPLYRNGYALMLNSFTTSALGLGYWIIAARNYTAATVGLNSAVISAMMFLAGVAQLNLGSATLRFIPGAHRATTRFVVYAYLISSGIAVVISFVFLHGLNIWAPTLRSFGSNPFLAGWFTIATIAWCIFVLQDSTLMGLRQAIWIPVENAVFSIAKIALLIGLAHSFPEYGLFASWSIGMLVTLLPVNALIFRRLIPRHIEQTPANNTPLVPAQVVRYVAADYVCELCWLASTSLLPLMVTLQAGAAANAYFFLSWQIASMLFIVSANMGSSLLVEAVNEPAKLRAYSKRIYIQTVRIVVPAAALLALSAPYVLHVFGNKYAAEAARPLLLLALSAIPFIINNLYSSIARVQRHMNALVIQALATCALVLSTSHFLLQLYGMTGACLGWLVSQTLVAAVLLCTKEMRTLWPFRAKEPMLEGELGADLHNIRALSEDPTGVCSQSHGVMAPSRQSGLD